MTAVQASPEKDTDRKRPVLRRRMGLADKLGLTICLILAFAISLSSLLNYFNFQSTYNSLVRSSHTVILRDIGYRIQYGLGLGLSLPSMDNIAELLFQVIDNEPAISTIQIFDIRGEILFHTESGAVGGQVPEEWRARAFRASEREALWATATEDDYVVGIPLINSFDQIEGALALTYPRSLTAGVFDRVKRSLIRQSILVIGAFGILSLLCAVLVMRRLTRTLKRLEHSLNVADSENTENAHPQGPLEEEFQRFRHALRDATDELEKQARRR